MIEPVNTNGNSASSDLKKVFPLRTGLGALRVRFTLQVVTEMQLGRFPGTTIRSALASVFRRMVCITKLPSCDECPLRSQCLYPNFFEATHVPERGEKMKGYEDAPNPYVLHFPVSSLQAVIGVDAPFTFDLYLFGESTTFIPHLIYAMKRLEKKGLSKGWKQGKGQFKLINVICVCGSSEIVIYDEQQENLKSIPSPMPVESFCKTGSEEPDAIRISLVTPMRLSKNRTWLNPDTLRMEDIGRGIVRRIEVLSSIYGEGSDLLPKSFRDWVPALRMRDRSLTWFHQWRYSSKQQQKMPMDGIVGSFTVEGAALAELYPILKLGEIVHAGKGTSMGMGQIRIDCL